MKAPRLLLLIFVAVPVFSSPCRAEPPGTGRVFNQTLAAQVTATAFAFMAPRTLDPLPIPQMAVWGLRCLVTLDPHLSVDLKDAGRGATALVLADTAGKELLTRPTPADTDAAAWGQLVGQVMRAAWTASDPVRRAGTQTLIRVFFDELFSHLDPYSRYAPPHEADTDRLRRVGRAGVGLSLVADGGGFMVSGVQPGGSAAQLGVHAGDRILAVGGQSTQGADAQAVAALLAGPEQTQVSLTLRGHDARTRTVVLERTRVPPETVLSQRNGNMLVLRVSSFSRNTGSRLAQELIRGLADPEPFRGVVIDLRGNRGGVLQQAVAAAAMVQPAGVVAVTQGRDPDANHVFLADGRDLAQFRPVIVLVDGGTASAAEILAAALADQRRAVVVGSSTLGKGLVQTITTLPDGGELLVTWSLVLAPLGWPIQGLGVLPQVCTSLGPEVLAHQLADLAHSIQPMAPALARHRAARAPLRPADVLAIRAACPAADGRDADLGAARYLIDTPDAYNAALLAPPPIGTAGDAGLTRGAPMSN